MANRNSLSASDHALVSDAVAAAEALSNGEIVTIAAQESDHYGDVAWAIAGLAALTALLIVSLFPVHYLGVIDWLAGGWSGIAALPYWALFIAAALKFFAVRVLLLWRPLLFWLIPPPIKHMRVRRRAVNLFNVSTNHRTAGRTGILLYLSMREHRAEIVADEAIAELVDPTVWGEAMAALIDHVRSGRPGAGMAEAVRQMGAVLAQHFPKSESDHNELPDRLIEL
jgi:putative membrane protein